MQYRKLQTATKPVHGYERMLGLEAEERKPVESMTAGVPLEGSAEPAVSDSAKEFTFPWTSVTATRYSPVHFLTYSSSLFYLSVVLQESMGT